MFNTVFLKRKKVKSMKRENNEYNISMSYFKAQANNPLSLSICPRTPPWYLMKKAEEITCPRDLYDAYFKELRITKEEFYEGYRQYVSKLSPYEVLEKYRGKVLLGWYKPDHFDCRELFARWILDETGIVIPEWDKNTHLLPVFHP